MRSRRPANRGLEESRGIAQLDQALLRCEPQYPRHVLQHVRAAAKTRQESRAQCKACTSKKAFQRLPARTRGPVFYARDDRLRRPRCTGKSALGKAGPLPRFDEEPSRRTSHARMIA